MRVLLEKLANHWQLRFLTIGALIALLTYAVVMPVQGNESTSAPVVASGSISNSSSVKAIRRISQESSPITSSAPHVSSALWFERNKVVVERLDRAVMLYSEVGLPRDASDLIHSLRKAAEGGDRTAQFLLGEAYQQGLGVPKDLTENARWYARANEAHKGSSNHENDLVGPRSYAEAFAIMRQSAERGDAMAELDLGLAYDQGNGVPKDSAKAALWYRKAAAQGSVSASCNLGELYHEGNGLPKDSEEAAIWLEKAASRGSTSAEYALGRMYLQGDGVVKSDLEAVVWLEKAAIRGNSASDVLLSSIYARGEGVEGSTAKAYMWINLAAAHDSQLRETLDELESDIPAEEVRDGQALTHDWLTHHSRSPESM